VPLVPQVDARWVEIWFRAPNQIRRLNGQAHEVARKTLNLEDVRRAVVPLPPLQQQRQIVEGVETLLTLTEAMQADVESAESRAESMRRAIFVSALLGATSEGAS
ncbi:MAG: restriction endonuclease subunit S, partial [Bryobacterales bacterium]|nr:restriction endonuclease subunit S [Bryobacterales bacterium]